jgi:hypothetical protein
MTEPIAVSASAASESTAGGGPERVRLARRELRGRARYFFQTPEWIERISPHVGADVVLGALVSEGRPLVASIVRRRVRRIAGVNFRILSEARVDHEPLAESLIGSGDDGAIGFDDLADLSGPWDVALLRRLRAGSPWLELADGTKLVRDEPDFGVAVLDTSMGFDDRWAAMSSSLRASIRAARRRIEARGGMTVAVATGEEVGAAFDAFVALEAAGWKGARGTALRKTPAMRDVLRGYLLASGTAQVRSLHCEGTLAASVFGVSLAGAFVAMKVTYDERLAELSPGSVLWADLIEACCADPAIARLDGVAWTPWLERWGMDREPTYTLIAFNSGFRGSAAKLGWPIERVLSSLRHA